MIHQMLSSDDAKKQLEELRDAINDGVLVENHVHPQIPKVNIPHKSEGVRVRFGDVVREVKEKIDRDNNPYEYYVAGDHMDSEDLKIRRRGRFDTDDVGPAFIRVFKPGQVLYGSRRTYLKKVCYADFAGITANTTFVLETKDENVLLQRLLPFLMLGDRFSEWSIKHSKGSTNPYILFGDLANYEFDLPSIARQRELANLLWAANDLKESYKKAIIATDEMLKAKFREMFGVCGGQKAEGDPNVAIWPLVTIGDISESVRYGTSKPGDAEGDYKYLRMNNLTYDGYFDFSDVKRISLDTDEIDKCLVQRGDILFNRTNTKEIVGKTSYFDFDEPMVIAGYIIRLRVDKRKVCPQYLWKLLNTNELKGKLRKMAKGAIHQANINAQELRSIEFPLPPLSLQREFVAIAERADAAKSALKQSIADIEQVMKGLING